MVKVLVVDDDDSTRDLAAAVLARDERCHVLLARGGKEALDIVSREMPDIILLDIEMPDMTGWEVFEIMKNDPATSAIKVIMLSGLIQPSVHRRAYYLGVDGYLTKPFQPGDLLDAVWLKTEQNR